MAEIVRCDVCGRDNHTDEASTRVQIYDKKAVDLVWLWVCPECVEGADEQIRWREMDIAALKTALAVRAGR